MYVGLCIHVKVCKPSHPPVLLVPFICDSKAEMPAVISKMVCLIEGLIDHCYFISRL